MNVQSKRLATLLTVSLAACGAGAQQPPVHSVQVVRSYPHDSRAFTQGLVIEDGVLYEGTGLEGQSELRRVDLVTGRVLQRHALPSNVFGEGITSFKGQVLQLTWKNQLGYVYDRQSFQLIRTFPYATEGWGLTHDGKSLILSDGSSTLYFLNPATFAVQRKLNVTAAGVPVERLNELEFVNGSILANVWLTDRIARIDPNTGRVTAWYDLSAIVRSVPNRGPDDVLNGIAFDARTGRLYVTGKRWPALFEVKLPGVK